MMIFDAHCDTITKIMERKENLLENGCHLDIKRMKNFKNYVQCFAAFIDPEFCQAYAMKRAIQIIDRFYKEIEMNSDRIMLCRNYNDILEAEKQGRAGAFLSIEGGDALQGDISALRVFYRLGVRSLCLTWNHRNEIADGVADGATGGGITPFGRTVIGEMNSLGMVVDVSHISEKGFWDVIEASSQPIVASHSNAKKLCGHRRNLSNEQLKALKANGGVTGINFCPAFLNDTDRASLKDIINHIEYIASTAGIETIGLGSDFDGIEDTPDGVSGVQDIEKVFDELSKLNYSQENIEKIAGNNFLRIIKQVCS